MHINAVKKREMDFSGIVYAGLNRVRPGPDRSQIMGVTDSVRFHQIKKCNVYLKKILKLINPWYLVIIRGLIMKSLQISIVNTSNNIAGIKHR